jgi:hypothetical protein
MFDVEDHSSDRLDAGGIELMLVEGNRTEINIIEEAANHPARARVDDNRIDLGKRFQSGCKCRRFADQPLSGGAVTEDISAEMILLASR